MDIKSKARRGPFSAQPGEAWVDAGLAAEREAALLETIEDLVLQFAGYSEGMLDSMAISALADAMRLLAQEGRMEIIYENNDDRVTARLISTGETI